jgi:DNA repair protein RecO (recombination protein O)
MLIKTRAIVLHHIKYGETSLIVTMYTEKQGRLSSMVNGVRSSKSRLPMTFFQPLTLLETELYFKPNRELHRLKELSCPFHYVSIPFTIAKSTMALFLAEILFITLREEEGNSDLFNFLFHAFQLLDTKDEGISNFHLQFLLHYTRYLGFSPADVTSLTDIARSSDLQAFRNLPEEATAAMLWMMKNSLAQHTDIRLSHTARTLLLDCILKYYAEHQEGIGRIKSYGVLKEIFSERP